MDIEQFAKQLANQVLKHREVSGLTQQQLAMYAGVGKTAVFDVEHGKTTVQLETIIKILQVLNIELIFKSALKDTQDA